MPAEECNNGLWKWGETGECKYDSQEEAEEDNKEYNEESENKEEINTEIEVQVDEEFEKDESFLIQKEINLFKKRLKIFGQKQ